MLLHLIFAATLLIDLYLLVEKHHIVFVREVPGDNPGFLFPPGPRQVAQPEVF